MMNTIFYDVTLYRYQPKQNVSIAKNIVTTNAIDNDLRDVPYMPPVREALPYNLRKAFDRAGEFYFDNNPNASGYISLYTKKGTLIGSLVAERRVDKK